VLFDIALNTTSVMVWQACAYKLGQLKIAELRKKAEEALGLYFILDL
jgi:uncharacterized protein (DUF885 family)